MYPSPRERLKELLPPFKKKYHRDFWALRDVFFDVREGEVIGIIGRNVLDSGNWKMIAP